MKKTITFEIVGMVENSIFVSHKLYRLTTVVSAVKTSCNDHALAWCCISSTCPDL